MTSEYQAGKHKTDYERHSLAVASSNKKSHVFLKTKVWICTYTGR